MSSNEAGMPTHIGALRRQIEKSLVTSISKQRFLPRNKLYGILTLPAIKGAVQELTCGPDYRIKLVDTIHNDCNVVFAMLIYNRLENYIVAFRRHGFLDNHLPLTKERAEEITGPEIGPRLALDFQWMFMPYIFRKSMLECSHQIGGRYILPFITAEHISGGAFGDVDKVGISPSQHEFTDQMAAESYVVRKRLRVKGRTEEFKREDKCLRLLNQLKHQNIIPLLGSYTYEEEHTFLFPYISMDLDKFLSAKERHGDFRWNFTFYSALTGLASALSKMHRLHLNERDHDVDFEAIGYHHDLRPPNVLVNSDTFILADFGLGSLKDLAALSHTPYKIIIGDYIAPECTDMDENPQTVDRSIDVWAFGCLILEIVTYMLRGSGGIQEFRRKRSTKGRLQRFKDAGFYQPDGKLKHEIVDWIEELKSLNPYANLVHSLLQLSLDALQSEPRRRPGMDEITNRLAALRLQEHFDSVQHMFSNVLHGEDQSASPSHHQECLKLAQKRFQMWGQVLDLREGVRSFGCNLWEDSVNIMRKLFHVLREDQDKRALSQLSALRSCQHQTDHCVKQLWDLLPDSLSRLAESESVKETVVDTLGRLGQTLSSSGTVIEDIPHASNLATDTTGLLSEFEKAIQSFKEKIPDTMSMDEIMQTNTIEKVYDITDKLQADQELRNLSKVQPYLQRMHEYAELVEEMIGGHRDFLSFLWGPLALLLLWSSKDDKAYRSIIDAIAEIGKALPNFHDTEAEIGRNAESKEILILFFRDVLDFYLVTLKLFSHPGWMFTFGRSWPKHAALVSEVASHMGRLTRLMRTEIRLEHIQQEHEFRKNALEIFEKQARETRKQEFYRIKTSFNLCSYDDTLYRHRYVQSPGTGLWLLNNETFVTWLHKSREDSRILWLVGIPGAGKSVLCCTVVDHLKTIEPNHTGFAFLTYEDQKATAISVMHSLIFQLADGSDELEGVVCDSTAGDIKTDIGIVRSLLTSLIRNSGPVHLVIDGIDEISIAERGRLVTEITKLAETCEDLRIVLSSRPEADLVRKLENATVSIRVHDHNKDSISAYVSHRSKQMFENVRVREPEQVEIQKLLAPVASRAEGMFLYARIIMDMITDVHDLSEVQNELVVLPESLDSAYHRIIIRLRNGKNKRASEKALRLLGWIACTTTPLTVEEAWQALVLDPSNRGQVYHMTTKLDAVKELGPIVETTDGYIRFVHFTAKEYISSAHLGEQLIDKNEASLDLAVQCIDYLCQRHHDLDLSHQEISEKILTGQYSFHAFSTKMWFELSRQYLRSATAATLSPKFVKSLWMLWDLRKIADYPIAPDASINGESNVDRQDISRAEDDFKPLQKSQPVLHHLLCNISRFRRSVFLSGKSIPDLYKNGGEPLSTWKMSPRIHHVLDSLLCKGLQDWLPSIVPECHEQCANIIYFYGSRPYKCEFPQCDFWRHGFGKRSHRDRHVRSHDLPLKCYVDGCEFGNIGFLSDSMRQKHLHEGHRSYQLQPVFEPRGITKCSIEPLLFDLVRQDRVEAVRAVLPSLSEPVSTGLYVDLTMVAAYAASGTMLELLHRTADEKMSHPTRIMHGCVEKSIKGRNRSTLEYLVTHTDPFEARTALPEHVEIMCQLLSIDWIEGTELWCRWYRITPESSLDLIVQRNKQITQILAHRYALRAAANHLCGEQQLMYIWRHPEFQSRFDIDRVLGTRLLKCVAASGLSTTLAEYLLEKGADVNFRGSKMQRAALHCAADNDSFQGAQMMKFLLLHGADPEAIVERRKTGSGTAATAASEQVLPARKIRDQVGPRGIHIWLGKNWDELVGEAKVFLEAQKVH